MNEMTNMKWLTQLWLLTDSTDKWSLSDCDSKPTKTCLWLRMLRINSELLWPSDQADWSQTYCLADWSSHKLNSNFSQSSFRAIFVHQWNSLSQKLSVICLMMRYENKSSLFAYFCFEIALSKNPEIAAISFWRTIVWCAPKGGNYPVLWDFWPKRGERFFWDGDVWD